MIKAYSSSGRGMFGRWRWGAVIVITAERMLTLLRVVKVLLTGSIPTQGVTWLRVLIFLLLASNTSLPSSLIVAVVINGGLSSNHVRFPERGGTRGHT